MVMRWGATPVLLLALACGGEEPGRESPEPRAQEPAAAETVPAPPPAPADTGISAEPPAGEPGDGWTVGRVEGAAGTGMAVLQAVRTGRQPEGWDRVVFEFGGDPLPGYRAEYVDSPQRQCGSGHEVRLPGDAWIQLDFEPAQAHDEEGRATVAERTRRPQLPNLLELRLVCDFEGQVSWVLGLRSPRPFRILELREPNRLVLDVRH